MKRTFYEFIRRFADPDATDPYSRLANQIVNDLAFPKQATEFNEISNYMEATGNYGELMLIFDDAWNDYLMIIS